MSTIDFSAIDWVRAATVTGYIVGAIVLGLIVHTILFRVVVAIVNRRRGKRIDSPTLMRPLRAPSRLLFPVIAVYVLLASEQVTTLGWLADTILYILLVIAVAWLLVRLVGVVRRTILANLDFDAEDNLYARRVRTQVDILRRVLVVAIVLVGIAAVLLHFETFRQIGTGLLASAGIAGIIVGFAAQKTLGNLIAGFQIAITQPIRVDDVVIVEGEWGRIEEITLTYVVVRIWDLRRLVVPISYFIEKPFQNWTRTSAELLGTIYLYVDYTVPFDAVREALHRFLDESEYWDGQVWRLHVTNTTDRTVELRALMSAANASNAWELRCEIREKLLTYIQTTFPEALPVVRAQLHADGDPAATTP